MVVEHIVLLKFKDDSREEDIQRFYDGVTSLKAIPGVLSITVGKTFCESWMPDRRYERTTHHSATYGHLSVDYGLWHRSAIGRMTADVR